MEPSNHARSNGGTGPELNIKDKMEPLAVIGFSARLPQDATSEEGFWNLLCEGRSARSEIPPDRFNINAFYHADPDRQDTINVKYGNFLKGDLGAFDAPFFSIQPTEAMSMDPQQRFMLEASYRALENAGLPLETVVGTKTSVFVGSSARDYESLLLRDSDQPAKYIGTGIGTSLLANRISWFFNFKGPSIALDTACSSSLSALHLGCQSLRSHESDMTLIGGCNLIIAPDVSMVHLSNMGFFSPDGKCYSFDSRANGYAKGEGVGAVIIKRLADAVRDGDVIRAVIRASGANQDGRTPGITQPSEKAQAENIIDTYAAGGLDLNETGFFEAHGTGTQIGDVIEASAIHTAFPRKKDNPLFIGALKPSIGHLEAASGIASIIKSVLILEHGVIPPNIFFDKPNPSIPVDEWNIKASPHSFPKELTPWPRQGVRRLSLNSFGYGGSNAHVVLEDAFHYLKARGIKANHNTLEKSSNQRFLPLTNGTTEPSSLKNGNGKTDNHSKPSKLFVWSASDEAGINRLATTFQEHLLALPHMSASEEESYLNNLAYTLSGKRSSLPWKSFIMGASVKDLQENLLTNLSKPVRSSTGPNLAFVFTGQGAQWHAMGRGLSAYPVYESSLQRFDSVLKSLRCEWSLIDELHRDSDLSRVDDPALAQPLCTAIQIALVELLSSWNIHPSAVMGHSSGEVAAAYCSNGLSFESAVKASYYRGLLASSLIKSKTRNGGMTSVALSEEDIAPYLVEAAREAGSGKLSVGCVNSATNVTITGDSQCIDSLNKIMDGKGVFARRLAVTVAYHSAHMEDVAKEYLRLLGHLSAGNMSKSDAPRRVVPMFSSVMGKQVDAEHLCRPEYWVDNLVSTVRFSEAFNLMTSNLAAQRPAGGKDFVMEIGPHGALQRPVKDCLKDTNEAGNFDYSSVLSRNVLATESCLQLMGLLRCRNYQVDVDSINSAGTTDLRPLTDLPGYPFNHSQTYWQESRISKNHRFRQHARHELLGTRVADWNPLEPKWRNIIRPSELQWVQDHKFNGSALYPASGLIVMAIEGSRQIADSTRTISGYNVKEVAFKRALIVDEDGEGVETQLCFRTQKSLSTSPSDTNDFTIYAWMNNDWAEICQGTISVEYASQDKEMDSTQAPSKHSQLLDDFERGSKLCREVIDSTQYYENLATFGYDFGRTFQKLHTLKYCDADEATCKISIEDGLGEEGNRLADHVVHPIDLDAVLQLGTAAISHGSWTAIPVMVPTQLKSLWISHELLKLKAKDELDAYAKTSFRGYREIDFTITALNGDGSPQVIVEGFRETAASNLDRDSAVSDPRRLCYSIEMKPDLEMLKDQHIMDIMDATQPSFVLTPPEDIDRQELVSLFYMTDALKALKPAEIEKMPWYLKKYCEWMDHRFDQKTYESLLSVNNNTELTNPATQEKFLNAFAANSPEGELIVETGRNLVPILRGERDALDLLFNGDLVKNFYLSPCFKLIYTKLSVYLDFLSHKNPGLKILEIGAGTGASTVPITGALAASGKDIPRFEKYVYTDISPAFFEKARERFSAFTNRMEFRVLDAEKDLGEQGFGDEKYDMIVAGLVLHATADLNVTLQNVKKLLKPGGKLFLIEPTNPTSNRVGFSFGLLSGWWLGVEENRFWGPLLCNADWRDVLKANGFSGAELFVSDTTGDEARQTYSAFIATAEGAEDLDSPREGNKVKVVTAKGSTLQTQVANGLKKSLGSTKSSVVDIVSVQELQKLDLKGFTCIFLLELETPFIYSMTSEAFNAVKACISSAEGIIWVTQGCGIPGSQPELGIISGLARNVMSENLDKSFVEVSFEAQTPPEQTISKITKVYQHSLTTETSQKEVEYVEKDGLLCLSRVAEAKALNQKLHDKLVRQNPIDLAFGESPDRALKLTVASPGLLDTLQFEDDGSADLPMGSDEVEIRVKASGMNFKDVMVAVGQVPSNTLGHECSGIVTRAGRSAGFSPGDRVCCFSVTGSYKTLVRTDKCAVAKIPSDMSFSTAAGLPVVFCTAYYGLVTLAHLQKGESVLIHSAAGGVGQAAVQIAKHLKANIFATVGTDEKKKLLVDLYGIPEDHIFSSRNTTFAKSLIAMNGGVDVVLNSLSGEGLKASWSCVAPLGRFIELGKTDINSREGLSMAPFTRSVTFSSVDLGFIMDKSKPLMKRIMDSVMGLLTGNSQPLKIPQPVHTYKVSEIEDAFRFMQTGKSSGKIVVEMLDDAVVPIVPSTKDTYKFEGDATYAIVGGLGGLGRSIIRWMVDRGARNILVISRSGASSAAAKHVVEEIQSLGVKIEAPPCNIVNENEVAAVLKKAGQSMPPIKGCMQGAMVLREALFENMTSEEWDAVTQPKVQGTWNLHKHLPKNLSFFVILSSIAGVTGSRGQANYAAANTYQDALARYRVSQGEKCISLNLGSIMGIGAAAERNLNEMLKREGFQGIRKSELFAFLDHCCDPALPLPSPLESQIVTGLGYMEHLSSDRLKDIYWTRKPLFSVLRQIRAADASGSSDANNAVNYAALLEAAETAAEASTIVTEALVLKMSKVLSIPVEDIDAAKPIHAFGIDSLVALEIRYWFAKEIKSDMSIFEIMGKESLFALGGLGAEKSEVRAKGKAE